MEKALTKLSSFTIPRKAKQELTAIGGDISRISSTVEEKAKWVFEKLKEKGDEDDEQEWTGGPGAAAHGEEEHGSDEPAGEDEDSSGWSQRQPRPCELFVCNLPRKCGVDELLELFRPYGTVLSVEAAVFDCKPNKSLPDLLRDYNLPPGLFPKNLICYEYDQTSSRLVVHLAKPCEVSFKDSSMIRYSTRVKATLSRGKLSAIEGMKTKVVVWVKVTSVNLESFRSDKVCFIAGVKKLRQKDAYEMPRESVSVEEF